MGNLDEEINGMYIVSMEKLVGDWIKSLIPNFLRK